jgi:hypothetical protein
MPLRRARGGGNALGLLMDEGDKVAVRTPMEYSSPTAKCRIRARTRASLLKSRGSRPVRLLQSMLMPVQIATRAIAPTPSPNLSIVS